MSSVHSSVDTLLLSLSWVGHLTFRCFVFLSRRLVFHWSFFPFRIVQTTFAYWLFHIDTSGILPCSSQNILLLFWLGLQWVYGWIYKEIDIVTKLVESKIYTLLISSFMSLVRILKFSFCTPNISCAIYFKVLLSLLFLSANMEPFLYISNLLINMTNIDFYILIWIPSPFWILLLFHQIVFQLVILGFPSCKIIILLLSKFQLSLFLS